VPPASQWVRRSKKIPIQDLEEFTRDDTDILAIGPCGKRLTLHRSSSSWMTGTMVWDNAVVREGVAAVQPVLPPACYSSKVLH
jgi:hypothetical protein